MLEKHIQRKAKKFLVSNTLLSCIALSVIAVPSLATAQSDSSSIFEEITVTAKKREQSIFEVPVAISAFTGAQIEAKGISDLVDIGKFVPNLNVTTFSAGHTSSANPFIRGIGLQDHLIFTDPGVAVYLDGVYLGRQIGQNWSLSSIERIEVLRGPQGTLYGRNSIGGAINIITQRPGEFEGAKVGLRIGTEDRLDGDFYGDIQMSETTALSINGAFKSRGGSGNYLQIKNPAKDVGEFRDVSARVAFSWKPTDDFSILLTADGNDGEGGMNPYTTLIDEVPDGAVYGAGYRNSDVAANPYDSNSGQANQVVVSNEARGVSFTADWGFTEDMNLRLLISDRSSEYRAGLDDDSFVDDFLSFPEVGEANQRTYELQWSGEFERWNFVGGLYQFDEDGFNFQDPTAFLTFPGDFLTSQDLKSQAVYANVGFDLTDRLALSGGLRYTRDEKNAFAQLNSRPPVFTPPGLTDGANREWTDTSWELAATWDMTQSLNIYGAIQSGYQSGQFPARPFCLFGGQPCLLSLSSDNITALNYEAGLKGTLGNNFRMSVAVFYTDYTDLPYQVSTTAGVGFDTRNIIVDQTSTGVEFEGTWAITDGFVIDGSFGYINVDVDDPEAVAPLTPEVTASLSPAWTFPVSNGSVTARFDYSYRDSMFGEPTDDPGRFTAIDSRSLINADIAYSPDNADWTLALYGKNLTDERYDNARLNTNDYILRILSNDIREYGLRIIMEFK
jgi:iron complex outermembrane receptor protein